MCLTKNKPFVYLLSDRIGNKHSSVGLDLRTEKSGFFAIWTGLGLDLTSHVGLRILAFGMECQSIPSHQTLKQKNCQN